MAIKRYTLNELSLRRIVRGTRRVENQIPMVSLARPPATRGASVADRGVPFYAQDDIPAYGAFVAGDGAFDPSYDPQGYMLYGARAVVHGGGPIVLINGDTAVSSGNFGTAQLALTRPVWAPYDASNPPTPGGCCGLEADSFAMAAPLPGFVCLEVDATNERALVLRTPGDVLRSGLVKTGAPNPSAYLMGPEGTASGLYVSLWLASDLVNGSGGQGGEEPDYIGLVIGDPIFLLFSPGMMSLQWIALGYYNHNLVRAATPDTTLP
jgi:hypothetical protein